MKNNGYFSSISFLWKYIKNYIGHFVIFQIGWLVDTIANVFLPVLLGVLVDEIVYYRNMSSFLKISILIVGLSIFLCLIYYLVYAQHQYLMNMYTYSIKKDIFHHWINGRADFLSSGINGRFMTLLQDYSKECFTFVIRNVIHFVNGIVKMAILTIVVFSIDWRVGLFVAFAAPLSVYMSVLFGKNNQKTGEKYNVGYQSYIGWLYERISSFETIRLLGAQKKVNAELRSQNTELYNIQNESEFTFMKSGNTISFINLCIRLTIYAFAGYLSTKNIITIGSLLIIFAYYDLLVDQIWWTSNSYIDSRKRIPIINSVRDFINGPLENVEDRYNCLAVSNGEIQFTNMDFSYYDNVPLYKDFSLKIKGGSKTAIVGASGCGKSTLAYLLLGFYYPQNGCITVDGMDISRCKLHSIRSNIGIVSQDVYLIDGSIRDNLLFGNISVSESDIINACKKAGIWEFICSLPDGLNTHIESGGYNISGGQRQRIAIARIYIRDPKIIIFDEATSSLDDETEKEIHKSWKEVLTNRTSLVITHKLSAVKLCDTIVVLKDGKVDEVGEYEYIINNKEFKRLFSISERNNEKESN